MVNSYAPLRFTILISFSLAAATSFKLSASHSPSSLPKATADDLLTVLAPPSAAAYTVNPAVSRELRSCLKFLVPFQPRKPIPDSGRCSLRTGLCSGRRFEEEEEDENSLVWWPPETVLELARLAVDSGGDPGSIHRALDPNMIPVRLDGLLSYCWLDSVDWVGLLCRFLLLMWKDQERASVNSRELLMAVTLLLKYY